MNEDDRIAPERRAMQDFWENLQNAPKADFLEDCFVRFLPRGSIIAIAIVLSLVIGLVSWLIYKRSEEAMAELLAEKGNSLLNVFRSALRTSMKDEAGLQLQTLLDEIARGADIEFMAVVMPDGTIIAHSEMGRIGDLLHTEDGDLGLERMMELAPTATAKWTITELEGRRVFLIYRHFTMGNKNWDKNVPEPTIFLALEVSPFQITNSQNRSFVAILAILMMLAVLCGLLAVSLAQRAVESRMRQRRAEGEVHRLAEEVRRNEKLAAVGTLAAGVAHEIRNPLSSIKGYATYFSQRFPEGSDDRQAATVMVNEVDRLNRVITDLLGLSRPDDVKLKSINLVDVAEHVMRLLRQKASAQNVQVVLHLALQIPKISGDMERLSQALLNICLNSIEAMPDGGVLEIAISGGKSRICLMTRDNGIGMGAEILKRIFDPYFTTKGTGTGLGLPMAHKIVKAHEGRMNVVSSKAGDTTRGMTLFHIWLPVAGACVAGEER